MRADQTNSLPIQKGNPLAIGGERREATAPIPVRPYGKHTLELLLFEVPPVNAQVLTKEQKASIVRAKRQCADPTAPASPRSTACRIRVISFVDLFGIVILQS